MNCLRNAFLVLVLTASFVLMPLYGAPFFASYDIDDVPEKVYAVNSVVGERTCAGNATAEETSSDVYVSDAETSDYRNFEDIDENVAEVRVGNDVYTSLEEAILAHGEGGVIEIVSGVARLEVDLSGRDYSIIVDENATLITSGNAALRSASGTNELIDVRKGGKLIVNGGSFLNEKGSKAVNVREGGEAEIRGGYFAAVPDAESEVSKDAEEEYLTEIIPDNETPLTAPETMQNVQGKQTVHWAIMNLIIVFITITGAVYSYIRRREGDNVRAMNFCGALTAAIAVVTFMLTENMNNVMAFADRWTPVMLIILGGQIASSIAAKKYSDEYKYQNDKG